MWISWCSLESLWAVWMKTKQGTHLWSYLLYLNRGSTRLRKAVMKVSSVKMCDIHMFTWKWFRFILRTLKRVVGGATIGKAHLKGWLFGQALMVLTGDSGITQVIPLISQHPSELLGAFAHEFPSFLVCPSFLKSAKNRWLQNMDAWNMDTHTGTLLRCWMWGMAPFKSRLKATFRNCTLVQHYNNYCRSVEPRFRSQWSW